jgi:hypothetical protein
MKHRIHWIFNRYMAPADSGEGGGGGVDRGDDWTPTDDDAADKGDAKGADDKGGDAKDDAKDDGEGGEGEGEGEDGEGDGDAKKDDPKAGKKDARLPLARHKEILAKERERRETLEREVAALKAGQGIAKVNEDITTAENKVLVMEKEYLDLLAKGEVDKAAAKMAEIRRTERAIVQANASLETQAAEARAYERVKYDTTVERLEAAYPAIDPDHDDFDKEVTAEVIQLRDDFIASGRYSRAEALQRACKMILKPATTRQKSATEVDVRVTKDDVAKALKDDRKKEAVNRNVAVAGKQPPNASNIGQDSDKSGGVLKGADVIRMDQSSFAKLSEADLSRLRGDTV